MEACLIEPRRVTTLLRLEFSPMAIKLDRYATSETMKDFPLVSKMLRHLAHFVSSITPHTITALCYTSRHQDQEEEDIECTSALHRIIYDSLALQSRLFLLDDAINASGNIASCIIVLWHLTSAHNGLDIYTSIKRIVPNCRLPLATLALLSSAYMEHRRVSYLPPSYLYKIVKYSY